MTVKLISEMDNFSHLEVAKEGVTEDIHRVTFTAGEIEMPGYVETIEKNYLDENFTVNRIFKG